MTGSAGPSVRKRVLLGHLGARGDCLYATAVARQIKQDFPDCHLTWAVGSMCRAIVEGNPYVDEIWEFPMAIHGEMIAAWEVFHRQAEARRQAGEFDEVYYTQIYPDNFRNFDGTVRASIFRGYPRPITVPVTPVVRLTDDEVRRVREFAQRHGLESGGPVLLFEYSAGSGQTFVDTAFARTAALEIVSRLPDARVILASHVPFAPEHPRIIDGSPLGFKENAELTKYCTLLIGCSSGLSWLCTSDWAKPLPKIQLLKRETSVFASFVHDHERFGLPTDQIIEITDCPPRRLVDCVVTAVDQGFAAARETYHEPIRPDFRHYAETMRFVLARSGIGAVLGSIKITVERYGVRWRLFSEIVRVGISELRRFARALPVGRIH